MRITPLALAAGLLAGGATAWGQDRPPTAAVAAASAPAAAASAAAPMVSASASAPAPSALQASPALRPLPRGSAAAGLPTLLQAQVIHGQPDQEMVAEHEAELRRGGLVIRADRLSYDSAQDLAGARGQVRVSRDGAIYSGPELQLHVQRFEGWFLQPEFEFTQLGAGGRADRIDFLDGARSRATHAEYTSCPRDGPEEPAWVLRTDSVTLDLDASEGVAKNAVLRFLGAPILALPSLSFPLSDARRSGWLPPSLETDNRNGIQVAMPYYWDIAPNRDATFTPRLISRRGLGLTSEFRYLEPGVQGTVQLDWLPYDRLTGSARDALQWTHDGQIGGGGLRLNADLVRVSDDGWWKDFPSATHTLTPRLLPQRVGLEQPFAFGDGNGLLYVRAVGWQVLQDSTAYVVAPYERSPQIGMRFGGQAGGWQYALETEYNHFTLPAGEAARDGRAGGDRLHVLGDLSWPLREPGWFVVPKLSFNAAAYADLAGVAGPTHASRAIPTFSLDAGLEFERQTTLFGRALRQTLEPRVLYLLTPYLPQSQLPDFDAAGKDFNFSSIYTDNQFSGIDRVSDANQLTAGVVTRFVDAASGAEALRLGVAQRYLFRSQRVTAQPDGTPEGTADVQHFSDALITAATTLVPAWTLDSTLQYSPDIQRSVRSVVGVRYAPGPLHTLSATYRLNRGVSEQLELGWQWPLWGSAPVASRAASGTGGTQSCGGTWYAVGRVNYSLRDRRVTDSVLGAEYDAGCWIARVVARSVSTGSSQATTGLMLQLELVGLSRLGSNPLKVLKDNIPGYRLLREDRASTSPTDAAIAPFND